ncbi:hypothetical protein ACIQUB_18090 [Rhizobium sp. NPDC090275]|uniref:hypothetical protein n=1 Tax=Rhizobium sp. NPDC090275 TaxID=3364498 RepID=UPI00383AD79D
MRSPWQVLKGFAARGKADGPHGHPDETGSDDAPPLDGVQTDESTQQNNLPDPITNSDTVSIRVSIAARDQEAPEQRQPAADVDPRSPSQTDVSTAGEDAPPPQLAEITSSHVSDVPRSPTDDRTEVSKAHGKQPARRGTRSIKAAASDHDDIRRDEPAVVDQAMVLETEINALRALLSQKLDAQNTHLRLLLERYDQ